MQHKILIYPHPCLTTPAKPVEVFDDALKNLVSELYATMYHYDGVGLAAPQVNISKRILVVDTSETRDAPQALINPVITDETGRELGKEGCLSFPGLYIDVERAKTITVKAVNEKGEAVELNADGLFSRCIQHEIDHLDGKVFVDHLSRLKRERALKKLQKLLREQAINPHDN